MELCRFISFLILTLIPLASSEVNVNINFKDMFNGMSVPQPSPAPTPATINPPTFPSNISSVKVRNNAILTNHTKFFVPQKIYDLQTAEPYRKYFPASISYRVYSAVGYDLANTIWLIGPNGKIVVVDALGDMTSVETVIADMRTVLNISSARLPIAAIIYTHNHIDHTGGVLAYLNNSALPPCPPEDTSQPGADGTYISRTNCVEIFSQQGVIDAVINTGTVVGTMINPRSTYMYGGFLGSQLVTNGIGKEVNSGVSTFRIPSRTFKNELKINAGGLNMQLQWAPSETDDELVVFLPDALNPKDGRTVSLTDNLWQGPGLLMTAEVIQGPAFPNLYSLRGTSYRKPVDWFQSVDKLRTYDCWCSVPSHGPPVCGKEYIELLLENFRDAIQYTHDQTVRFLNKGYTPDEMQSYLDRLPSYLIEELNGLKAALPSADMDPTHYLLPLYGSVPQAVRQIYYGYLGWYTADPVHLQEVPPARKSERYIKQMGGRSAVLLAAIQALKDGKANQDKEEFQWAAELASHLITVNPNDREARSIKAQAFLWLAEPLENGSSDDWRNWDTRSMNPNWRNWYLSSVFEMLRGDDVYFPPLNVGLVSPAIISYLPPSAWVNSWTLRMQAEKALNRTETLSLGFQFPPDNSWGVGTQRFVLQIRKAVARFFEVPVNESSAAAQSPAGVLALSLWRSTNCTIELTRTNLSTALQYEAQSLVEVWRNKTGVFKDQDVKLEKLRPLSYSPPQTFDPLADILKLWVRTGRVPLLRGNSSTFDLFLSYFDPPLGFSPHLSLR